nr:response regulator [Nocardioides convexus]
MGLPDRDGLWVCQEVRKVSAVPIVALTARRAERAVVAALRAGVDDYVTKPYSLDVLLARVEAVLRRATPVVAPPAADLGVEPARRVPRGADRGRRRGADRQGVRACCGPWPARPVARSAARP